jgi:hypothetical protein
MEGSWNKKLVNMTSRWKKVAAPHSPEQILLISPFSRIGGRRATSGWAESTFQRRDGSGQEFGV